jgi:hypothetical protein
MVDVFKNIWAGWKRIALTFARFQTLVLLTLFYFLVIVPFGSVFRLMGWDPLRTGKRHIRKGTNWRHVKDGRPDLKSMHRMS